MNVRLVCPYYRHVVNDLNQRGKKSVQSSEQGRDGRPRNVHCTPRGQWTGVSVIRTSAIRTSSGGGTVRVTAASNGRKHVQMISVVLSVGATDSLIGLEIKASVVVWMTAVRFLSTLR